MLGPFCLIVGEGDTQPVLQVDNDLVQAVALGAILINLQVQAVDGHARSLQRGQRRIVLANQRVALGLPFILRALQHENLLAQLDNHLAQPLAF